VTDEGSTIEKSSRTRTSVSRSTTWRRERSVKSTSTTPTCSGTSPRNPRETDRGDQRRRSGLRPGGGHGAHATSHRRRTADLRLIVRAPRRHHRLGRGEPGSARPSVGSHGRSRSSAISRSERSESGTWSSSRRWSIPSAWASLPTGRAAGSSTSTSGSRTSSIRTASDCWSCRSVTSIGTGVRTIPAVIGRPSRKGNPDGGDDVHTRRPGGHRRDGDYLHGRRRGPLSLRDCPGHTLSVNDRKSGSRRSSSSRTTLSASPTAGNYKYQSPSAERILGYEREALIGENAFEYIHPDDQEGGDGAVRGRHRESRRGARRRVSLSKRRRLVAMARVEGVQIRLENPHVEGSSSTAVT